jgi:hypothetical protein
MVTAMLRKMYRPEVIVLPFVPNSQQEKPMRKPSRIAGACFGCAAALLLLFTTPALAQEDAGEVVTAQEESTAATEVISEGALIFGAEDVDQVSEAKTTVQGTDKLQVSEDAPAAEDNKPLLFLPQVVGSANAVQEANTDSPMAYWRNIKVETFEGLFPNTLWRVYDSNGTTNGEYYWDDDNYKPYSGSWSAWPANGGRNARDPQYYYYPNNARSWMKFGPFSLRYAQQARLFFRYWNQSEANYDKFWWTYSCNGTNFYGGNTSGNSGGWRYRYFNIPCRGDSTVWIGFYFQSDGSVVDDGPFVDNVYIQEYR